MINWENGKPNARYWSLKLLKDNFEPGDKLVETNPFIMTELDYVVQGFNTKAGKKVLIINKRNKIIDVKVPANFKGVKISTVDENTGENEAIVSILNDDILKMEPNAVIVITISD